MFVVTNRKIDESKTGLNMFGETPNEKGPHELRLFEATRTRSGWRIQEIPDVLDDATVARLAADLPSHAAHDKCYGSALVAHRILQRAQRNKENLLFFVHGFNNDVGDMLRRADAFERRYGVQVLSFSWPANGGGVRGVASYKSDKRDARASVGALDRVLAKMTAYLKDYMEQTQRDLWQQAESRHKHNPEKRDSLFAELVHRACPFTVNMLAHSMGNYLYKHLLLSTASEGSGLLFDNVILACADTNNLDHARWTDRIRCRKRVYITINESDQALAASRVKAGQEQLARLGHSVFGLDSRNAIYVDFTAAPWVKRSHSYFEGTPVSRNPRVRKFFNDAINGRVADADLRYRADRNLYTVR